MSSTRLRLSFRWAVWAGSLLPNLHLKKYRYNIFLVHRFARLIGRDLAAFYTELGETGKAVVFLMDALRSYEEQGWKELAAQTRLELVSCAQKMGDVER